MKILLFSISILYLIMPVSALLQPWGYGDTQCELIAKDYQKVYGGSLMFIQPLKDNGAFDLGEYNGHFLNKVWDNYKGTYYVDYQTQSYFNNESEILEWYLWAYNRKTAVVYDLGSEHPPFSMIYH